MVFDAMDDRIRRAAGLKEKLPHFLCFVRENIVIPTKMPKSEELRVKDRVLCLCWVG